jgi:hypothetical protein
MQATIDNLCAERDKHVGEQRMKYPGTSKVIKGPPPIHMRRTSGASGVRGFYLVVELTAAVAWPPQFLATAATESCISSA